MWTVETQYLTSPAMQVVCKFGFALGRRKVLRLYNVSAFVNPSAKSNYRF
jgi:hypothetical protein